jgi:hypothetical protein
VVALILTQPGRFSIPPKIPKIAIFPFLQPLSSTYLRRATLSGEFIRSSQIVVRPIAVNGMIRPIRSVKCESHASRRGLKKGRHCSGIRIDSCQIRAFVPITFRTGEGEVFKIITSTMLARNDVFDVIPKE